MRVDEFGYEAARALVVWGDEPSDFALAMAWDRTYSCGIWIPDEWWQDTRNRQQIAMALDILAGRVFHRRDGLIFTSTSLEPDMLEERLQAC
jgi:hypothetical protein